MFTARAVSITRSTSAWLTSLSLIATMPCELMLRTWLPAIPVYTSRILQSAMSSASSRARWMALTVDSILTTTPFFRPREGWLPMPMISSRPSGRISATIATIFEVPISSPTIRFFCSLVLLIARPLSCFAARRAGSSARPAHRKAVGVTQIDIAYRHRQSPQRFFVHADKAGQPRLYLLPPQLHGHAAVEPQLPGAPVVQHDLAGMQADGLQQLPELGILPRHLLHLLGWPGKYRQQAAGGGLKQLAMAVDQRHAAPARQGDMLLQRHLDAVRPAPPHIDPPHPRQLLEGAAHPYQIHSEEIALQLALHDKPQLLARHMLELPFHLHPLQGNHRQVNEQEQGRVQHQHGCQRVQQIGQLHQNLRLVPHVHLFRPQTGCCPSAGARQRQNEIG